MPRRVAEMRRSFFVQGSHSIPLLPKNHKLPYAYARVRTGTRERAHAPPQTRVSKYQNSHLSHQNFHQNKFSLTNNAGKKTIARFKKRAMFFISFCISQFMQSALASRIREPNTKIKRISNNARGKKQRTAAEKIILAKDCFSRSFQRTLPGGINLRARNNRWKRALSSRFPQATLSA